MEKLSDKARLYARTYEEPPTGREVEGTVELLLQMADELDECEALREKQTPMKVKERKILRDMYGHPYTIRGDCPVCGSAGLLASNTDYCNACGQKLKWD